jgi:fatty acid desaturase
VLRGNDELAVVSLVLAALPALVVALVLLALLLVTAAVLVIVVFAFVFVVTGVLFFTLAHLDLVVRLAASKDMEVAEPGDALQRCWVDELASAA